MKKLILIIYVICSINFLFAQVEESITLYDGDASSSGYTMIKDEVYTIPADFCNLIAYTTYSGGNSVIRVQSVSSISQTINYDVRFRIGDKPTITSIVHDATNSYNVMTGFCEHAGNTKMFIAQIDATTGALVNHRIYSIYQGNGFTESYSLDLIHTVNPINPAHRYIAVGYVSDNVDAIISQKIPYVACFDYALNISWVKAHLTSDKNNIFNSIVNGNTNLEEFVVGGMLQKDPTNVGNATRWLMTVIKFTYTGTEVDNKIFITHPITLTPNWPDIDLPFVCDLLYSVSTDRLYILSFNHVNEGLNVDQMIYSSFVHKSTASISLPRPSGLILNYQGLGSRLLEVDNNSFAIAGYSNRILTGVEREIIITRIYLDAAGNLSPYTLIQHYPIVNTNFASVNPNMHFNTLFNGHAPHAFLPSNATLNITNLVPPNVDIHIYVACNRISNNTNLYPTIIGHNWWSDPQYECEKYGYACEGVMESPGYYTEPTLTSSVSGSFPISASTTLNNIPVFIKTCNQSFKTSNLNILEIEKDLIHSNNNSIDFFSSKLSSFKISNAYAIDLEGRRINFIDADIKSDKVTFKFNQISPGFYFLCIPSKEGVLSSYKFVNTQQ